MPLKGGSQVLPFDPVGVGQRFEEERERLLIKRSELAATCEYSPEQVRRIERGDQAPGARLLAALAMAGGDLKTVLLGGTDKQVVNEAEAMYQAEYRDRIRREAREYSRLKADRRKKVLTDDEADLIDMYRELGRVERAHALNLIENMRDGEPGYDKQATTVVSADRGSLAAGGDVNIGPGSGRGRK